MRVSGLILIVFVARAASAQAPGMMNYQGYLTDTGGTPLSGTYNMTFSIHDSNTGGGELWSETQLGTPVSDGLFSVLLGETNPLDASVFAGEAWLELEVDGELMTPRVRVVSVGYSFVAAVAYKAAADSVDSAAITDGEIANADLSATAAIAPSKFANAGAADGEVLKWSDADSMWKPAADAGGVGVWTVSGNDVYYDVGNVGIGTTTPGAKLEVAGDVLVSGAVTFAPPKTRCFSMPACVFIPDDPGAYNVGYGGIWQADAEPMCFYAPVHLPSGATITDFLAFVGDSNAAADITLQLMCIDLTTPDTVSYPAVLVSSGSPGNTTISATGIGHVVDNATFGYVVKASWNSTSSDLILRNARIYYTITEPLP